MNFLGYFEANRFGKRMEISWNFQVSNSTVSYPLIIICIIQTLLTTMEVVLNIESTVIEIFRHFDTTTFGICQRVNKLWYNASNSRVFSVYDRKMDLIEELYKSEKYERLLFVANILRKQQNNYRLQSFLLSVYFHLYYEITMEKEPNHKWNLMELNDLWLSCYELEKMYNEKFKEKHNGLLPIREDIEIIFLLAAFIDSFFSTVKIKDARNYCRNDDNWEGLELKKNSFYLRVRIPLPDNVDEDVLLM